MSLSSKLAARTRRTAVALGILVALISAVAYAVSETSGNGAAADPLPRTRPEVFAALQAQYEVSVIVSLREPEALHAPRFDIDAVRAQVESMQAGVLAALSPADFDLSYRYQAVPALAGRLSADGLAALAYHPDVVEIALDGQGSVALSQSVPLIHADVVHTGGVTGAGVVVAVLDSGVDTNHPDLAGDIVYEACFLSGGGCPGGAHPAEDDHGHGTNVAGIITGGGVVAPIGVAPDAQIAAYKILNAAGFGFFSDWTAALDDIIANHPEVDIVNMSLGSDVPCPAGAMATAITTLRSLGAPTFIAAGNHGIKNGFTIPACITDGLSVGATYDADLGKVNVSVCSDLTTTADQVACWSDSHDSLDLLAPGAAITSAGIGGGISTYFGTSQAAPHAAGTGALLLDYDPTLSPDQVEACLESSGVPITDAANSITTPRVDALAALTCGVISTPTPCPPEGCPTPTVTPTPTDTLTPTNTPTPMPTPIGCDVLPWDWDLANCFATESLWHWEAPASVSGMSGGMLAFNQGCTGPGVTACTYDTGATVAGRATSPTFDAPTGAVLTFKTARSTENFCGVYDRTFVLHSTNGGASY